MDVEKRFAQSVLAAVSIIVGLAAIFGCAIANFGLPIFAPAAVTIAPTPMPWAKGDLSLLGDFVLIQPFTIQGTNFKPNDSIDIFVSNTEIAPIERWTRIGEALGENRVKADGIFILNNLRMPANLAPPYYLRARASSDKRLTCSVLYLDKTAISGGVTARGCDGAVPIIPAASVILATPVVIVGPQRPSDTPIPPLVTAVPAPSTPTPLALVTTTPVPATATPMPPTPVPTDAVGYWFGRFYGNPDRNGSVVYEAVPTKDLIFNWGLGSPAPGVPADNFSAIWERTELFNDSDLYEFNIKVDDGVQLFIDNELISPITEMRPAPLRTIQVTRFINAGPHPMRVEYFDDKFNATLELTWRKVSPAPGAFQGRFYNNTQATGPIVYKSVDAKIDFDWSLALPPLGVNPDGFSVKWDGVIPITRTGRYLFTILADGGISIFINNLKLIDESANSGGRIERALELPITAIGSYNTQILYIKRGGGGQVKVDWQFIPPPATITPTPSVTPLPTNTTAPSATPQPSATPTFTPLPTRTPTQTITPTPSRTSTPAGNGGAVRRTATFTPTPTQTP